MAVRCFELALKQNTALSHLKYGEFIEENIEFFSKEPYNYNFSKPFELYVKATKLSNSTIAARAYYNIGHIISLDISIIHREKSVIEDLFGTTQRDIVRVAYEKSKELFEYHIRRNMKFTDTDRKTYNDVLNILLSLS